jgi:hypothetical protein
MFQPVKDTELYYNQKYKIVSYDTTYTGIYKGKYWRDELYLEFINVRDSIKNYPHRYFLPSRMIYRFVSQKAKIQSDMEHRALNLIISGIIGDTHFIW